MVRPSRIAPPLDARVPIVRALGAHIRSAAAAALIWVGASAAGQAQQLPDLTAVSQRSVPAVVAVTAQLADSGADAPELPPGSPFQDFVQDFFGNPSDPDQPESDVQGTGFVIDPAGFIVTHSGIVSAARRITVIFPDGTTLPTRLVGSDEPTGLALIKVDAGRPLAALRWGDSERVRIGDRLIAIGNPFALGPTVSAGILSGRARAIDFGPYDDFLQTDAALNRGSAGGPLLTPDGAVVGVSAVIPSLSGGSSGIGFAIPSALARPIVEQLRATGRVRRGWLGVQVQRLTPELAAAFELADARGALVSQILPQGPAERSGLRAGDVIQRVGSQDVASVRRLLRIVAETRVGSDVPVRVVRRNRTLTIRTVMGELDPNVFLARGVNVFAGPPTSWSPTDGEDRTVAGLRLRSAIGRSPAGGDRPRPGAIVREAITTGSGPDGQIAVGDVVVAVGGSALSAEIPPVEQIARAVSEAANRARPYLPLLIERGGDSLYVAWPVR